MGLEPLALGGLAWSAYWASVERRTGNAVDEARRRAEFAVGRTLTCVQYLPFAIEHFPEAQATAMLQEVRDRCRSLRPGG